MSNSLRQLSALKVAPLAPLFAMLAILALAGEAQPAAATMPFLPVFDLSVSDANQGVRANTTTVHSVPAGNHLIDSVNIFIPIDWQIPSGSSYPLGETVGQVFMTVDLGCNGSIDTLSPGSLINQPLGPSDASDAEWLASVGATWQLLFVVDQTTQPREWQIAVTLNNASMPANMCSPQELKLSIFGTSSPTGALVIANPTHAATYVWEDGLLSLGGSHIVFVSDSVVIGTDSDADGLANTIDNCPTVPNPAQTNTDAALAAAGASVTGDALGDACDTDDDNDSWSDTTEASIGTNPLDNCQGAPGGGGDAWPADVNNDGFVDTGDIALVTGSFGLAVPPALARRNIAPDPPDGFIDTGDVGRVTGLFGVGCG